MNPLAQASLEVAVFMSEQGWRFCIVGGLAVQRWGEPRTTLDADFTLWADWRKEDLLTRPLFQRFQPRLADAEEYARLHRVVLIRASNDVDVDVILAALPFEESMIERATDEELLPGAILPCCTAEDLFIMKAFAGRPRDWLDAESIALRQANALDLTYILEHLEDLCLLKDDRECLMRAKHILEVTG